MSGKSMSSEEIDALTTSDDEIELKEPENEIDKLTTEPDEPEKEAEKVDESTLAAEALKVSKPADEADGSIAALQAERTRLISEISGLRNARRGLVQETMPVQPQPATVQEKSPLEAFCEEHPDDVVPAKVHLAEKQYQDRRAAQQQQITTQQSQSTAVEQSLQTAMATITTASHGVDFQTMVNLGSHLLTAGDRLDIMQAGANAGQVTYQRIRRAVLDAGGPIAEYLSKNLKQSTQAQTKKTTKTAAGKTAVNVNGGPEHEADRTNLRASTRAIVSGLEF